MAVPELVWTDCGAGAQCSTAQVPRNYLDLAAGSLELAIARRPASDPAQRIGSLFVNFGGPGVPAYDLVAESAADLFGPEVLALRHRGRGPARHRAQHDDDYVQGPEGGTSVACGEAETARNPLRYARTARELDQVTPYFGSPVAWMFSLCASWPGEAADRYTGPWSARTAKPALIVGTRDDPSTNYASAVKLNELLEGSRLLTLDGYGRTAQLSTCVDATVAAHLVSLATPPVGSVCAHDVGPFDAQPAPAAETVIDTAIATAAQPEAVTAP